MSDQRNLMLAIALSVAILFGFQFLYEMPRQEARQAERAQQQELVQERAAGDGVTVPGADGTLHQVPRPPGAEVVADGRASRAEALQASARIAIETPRLNGSISLLGGRIDDLTLKDYHVTPQPGSADVVLLSPPGTERPYYAILGWTALDSSLKLPGPQTLWQADADRLTPDRPVRLTWDNGEGLTFVRTVSIDRDYLITVEQEVRNATDRAVELYPYGTLVRVGTPATSGIYILHEGPLGVLDGTLSEYDYEDLQDSGTIEKRSQGGWIGITDKYWLTALVPESAATYDAAFRHGTAGTADRYRVDYRRTPETVPPGASVRITDRVFAGAKEVQLLDRYADRYDITLFDKAVDFGWFYFLTKPIFYVLDYFYRMVGNFGIAIILLTLCVKIIFFPLANKSYKAMSRMKALQPEMVRLRDKYGDDKQKMNQELMALYKREKVNPAAGCLPILVQIPVFFALYKVLYVTIEMRHAPFFGWIHDLSAPDPTTIFNLFGLIPFSPPHFLMVGVWPLLMGVSMFLQQKLNPQPTDPMQARIFMMLPIVFTFVLAGFPAGLVIYWTTNNVLSIVQQYVIMRRMGVPIGNKATA